jgi:hypothetical protein
VCGESLNPSPRDPFSSYPPVISGCYATLTSPQTLPGSLRVIDTQAGQKCLPLVEKALSWSQTGPQGPQGIQGIQGPPGPFPGTLPSGATLRGVYSIKNLEEAGSFAGQYGASEISFGFALP